MLIKLKFDYVGNKTEMQRIRTFFRKKENYLSLTTMYLVQRLFALLKSS